MPAPNHPAPIHQAAITIFNRHKARTLTTLEEINCPQAYLEVMRSNLDYLRNDLLTLLDSSGVE